MKRALNREPTDRPTVFIRQLTELTCAPYTTYRLDSGYSTNKNATNNTTDCVV